MYRSYSTSYANRKNNQSIAGVRHVMNHKLKKIVIFTLCIIISSLSFGMIVKAYAMNTSETSTIVQQTTSTDNETVVNSSLSSNESFIRLVVQNGDSLWSIASLYKPDKVDIRSYVLTIKKLNQLTSSMIEEGQVLHLPASQG